MCVRIELRCDTYLMAEIGIAEPRKPGWFLLSASEQYFKRAWANTFDFLPPYWQYQQKSANRCAFNRSKPRASHF